MDIRKVLARLADRLTPTPYRDMMTAYLNELEYVQGAERKHWKRGVVLIWLWSILQEVLSSPLTSATAILCGAVATGLDLQLSSRLPYTLSLFLFAAALAAIHRHRWIRWSLLPASILPIVILITGEWGPYVRDRADAFYGIVPAFLGAALVRFITRPRQSMQMR